MLPEITNPIPSHYEAKMVWRTWAKAQRSFVCSSLEVKWRAEEMMVTLLQRFIENNPHIHTVGLYLPFPYEPNLLSLLSQLPYKNWVMPRVGNPTLGELKTSLFFHQVPRLVVASLQACRRDDDDDTPSLFEALGFVQNQWQLWEPPAIWKPAPPIIDLLIIPALAMDAKGIRLGYGGGYYDRCLAVLTRDDDERQRFVQTIGVCWAACKVPSLPKEPLDIALQAVCTEASLFCL